MSVVLATGGFDSKIRFWDAPSGVCSRIIKFPDSQVNKLEITPDKQFIAAAGNPVIRLYEILSSAPVHSSNNPTDSASMQQQAVLTLEGHSSNVTAIGFQKDGRYLYSGSEDGTIKIWDLRNPHYSRSFDSGSAVNSVTLRTDRDELISADSNGYVKVWDLGGNGLITSVQPSVNWAGEASKSSGGGPRLKQRRRNHSESTVSMQAVDISEDSRTLVAVSNHGAVYAWDPSSGMTPSTTSEGSLVNTCLLRPITKFRASAPGYYCLHAKIAPDCRHLVTTGSDGLAKLWDTTTWELTATLENSKWVYDGAFCADSSYLVTSSSDHIARLWNLKTGEVVRKYHGHQGTVTCVALNDASI